MAWKVTETRAGTETVTVTVEDEREGIRQVTLSAAQLSLLAQGAAALPMVEETLSSLSSSLERLRGVLLLGSPAERSTK